jgi:hypothetical protein
MNDGALAMNGPSSPKFASAAGDAVAGPRERQVGVELDPVEWPVFGRDLDALPTAGGGRLILPLVLVERQLGAEVLLEDGDLDLHFRNDVAAYADFLACRRRHQRRLAGQAGIPSIGTVPNTPRTSSEWNPRPALR